jgi:hypothetical protein
MLENTTLQKLDLFPSPGEGRNILEGSCCSMFVSTDSISYKIVGGERC